MGVFKIIIGCNEQEDDLSVFKFLFLAESSGEGVNSKISRDSQR